MRTDASRLPRWAWVALGLAALGLAVYVLRDILSPIFAAFLIAYLLDPLVDRFEARGVPRAVGIVLVLAVALGGIVLFALLLVPALVREVIAFGHELPDKLHGLQQVIAPRLAEIGIELPRDVGELRAMIQELGAGGATDQAPTEELASTAASALGTVGRWIWGGTATVLGVLTSLLIVPVLAFYLLYDFDRLTSGAQELIPHRYRPFAVDVAKEIDQVLGQFIRGQLMVMLVLAVLYSVAYSLAGVRLAIPIAIVAGMLSFIPYVGGASALILALLMCALSFESWWQVGVVVASYGAIQLAEGLLITPRVVGDKVGLPAVWVLIALMVGGELFGFAGVLLAVPMAAIGKIFVMRAIATYRKTQLYQEGRPEAPPAIVAFLEEEGLPDDEALAKQKEEAHQAWLRTADTEHESERGDQDEREEEHEDEDEPRAEPEPEEEE